MRATQGKFSIIVTGKWNPAILSPDWINENIYKKPELRINIGFPVNDPTLPMEIGIEDLRVYPRMDRLEIVPNETSAKALNDAVQLAADILSHLSHTPINAVGINFGFEENDSALITSSFDLTDSANIDRKIFSLNATGITRSFKIEKDSVLNLMINFDEKVVILDFNYHHQFQRAKDAVEFLRPDDGVSVAEKYYAMTKSFVKDVYGIDLE